MANHKGKETVTLEALLRLKRLEQPGRDFWDSFENDFQQRRLRALMERDTLRGALWGGGWLRAAALAAPVLLLLSGLSFWGIGARGPAAVAEHAMAPALAAAAAEAAHDRSLPVPTGAAWVAAQAASNQFVVDAFEIPVEAGLPFRRVLYTPAIRLSPPSGSSYVKDSLSAGNYQVTTADLRLGRNF